MGNLFCYDADRSDDDDAAFTASDTDDAAGRPPPRWRRRTDRPGTLSVLIGAPIRRRAHARTTTTTDMIPVAQEAPRWIPFDAGDGPSAPPRQRRRRAPLAALAPPPPPQVQDDDGPPPPKDDDVMPDLFRHYNMDGDGDAIPEDLEDPDRGGDAAASVCSSSSSATDADAPPDDRMIVLDEHDAALSALLRATVRGGGGRSVRAYLRRLSDGGEHRHPAFAGADAAYLRRIAGAAKRTLADADDAERVRVDEVVYALLSMYDRVERAADTPERVLDLIRRWTRRRASRPGSLVRPYDPDHRARRLVREPDTGRRRYLMVWLREHGPALLQLADAVFAALGLPHVTPLVEHFLRLYRAGSDAGRGLVVRLADGAVRWTAPRDDDPAAPVAPLAMTAADAAVVLQVAGAVRAAGPPPSPGDEAPPSPAQYAQYVDEIVFACLPHEYNHGRGIPPRMRAQFATTEPADPQIVLPYTTPFRGRLLLVPNLRERAATCARKLWK